MQGIKLIEETKTDNPWGGKHIIRKMQGYGYDIRIVFDTEGDFPLRQIFFEPTKCKNEFHFLFQPVYNPSFQEKGIESFQPVKLSVEKMDEVATEFDNVKKMFKELDEREEELFRE